MRLHTLDRLSRRLLNLSLGLALAGSVFAAAPTTFTVARSGPSAPDTPALIFVPGLACNGSVWDDAVARYAEDYDCHVLSLAGFAGTPAADNHDAFINSVRDELITYIREEKLHNPVLIGHSLGGFTGLKLSLAAPDLLHGLMIVDSLPFFPAGSNPAATVDAILPMATAQRNAMRGGTMSAAQSRQMMAMMVTDPADVERAVQMTLDSDPAAVAQAYFEINTTDLRDQLDQASTPTVVLGSWIAYQAFGATEATTRAIFEAQYAKHPQHRIVMSPKGRHFIQWDDPEFFFAELDTLLADGQ
ncbi:alpha/beta fold hydrolase [Actomonas aquatica]|uniref:Alpha/beta fold hydrolase n=1 Tax=Actomonas aquatica TaxID=2866162 RepID=A0ABZ1C5K4_9BACT|nr:alpha/beta fold hydrolase [Opitutus sp. WL0086]WRQ85575.1 alpha/beta fold hydrolase [Opitutus sp. WL0086]